MSRKRFSVDRMGWRMQIAVAFALMSIIPMLTFGYFLFAYVMPSIVTQESVLLIVSMNLLLCVAGYLMLRKTVHGLTYFRDHMERIARGDLATRFLYPDGPDLEHITRSVEVIVDRLQADRLRLESVSEELETTVKDRTSELRLSNERLERELEEKLNTEQALRESNMKLSDALSELKQMNTRIIQQERLSALGQMATGIAHDFNNALMPILGLSEFLLSNPEALDDREELIDSLQDIRSASEDAREVVHRLREFYKAEGEIELSAVDINEVIERAVVMTRPRWKEELGAKGITIKMDRKLADLPPVSANPAQLREVLTNLILNSVDALPEGGLIEILTRLQGNWIVVEVIDSGTGMPDDVRRRCFEPFFSTKDEHGTGIGMAMAHGIIRQHKGMIDVNSEVGTGTRVTIHLPLVIATGEIVTEQEAAQPIRGLHILLVEDDDRSAKLMGRYLKAGGHAIEHALTGGEGMKRIGDYAYDLLITDRALPDMSGDKVAMASHEQKPDIPIIMLTGFGELMKEQGEKPEGVDVVLSKPTTHNELKRAIAAVFRDKE